MKNTINRQPPQGLTANNYVNRVAKVERNSRTTKISQVLRHLESGKSLTPLEALLLYDTFILKEIVYTLRRRGYKIKTDVMENQRTGARFASYSMIKK